jgi:hypothetical protein
LPVLPDQCIQRMRQGKDHMEVGDRQESVSLPAQPLFSEVTLTTRAVPVATTMRHEVLRSALLAEVTVSSQARRAAGEDRAEHFAAVSARSSPSCGLD